jgi:hypothetical protein
MRLALWILNIYIAGLILSTLYLFAFETVPFGAAVELSLVWPRLVYEAIVGP